MKKLTLKNIIAHFKTIYKHRKYVRYYARLAGIPIRGWLHDLSKYSPVEFFESARYYTGTISPIDKAKKDKGFSLAWLHHRGCNRHHWAYWVDNFSEGMTVYMMPKNDFVEMVCDFLGAGKAYSKNNFSFVAEQEWWERERERSCKAMNIKNKHMLDIIFNDLAYSEKHADDKRVVSPEQLIKNKYIQQIWEANK